MKKCHVWLSHLSNSKKRCFSNYTQLPEDNFLSALLQIDFILTSSQDVLHHIRSIILCRISFRWNHYELSSYILFVLLEAKRYVWRDVNPFKTTFRYEGKGLYSFTINAIFFVQTFVTFPSQTL